MKILVVDDAPEIVLSLSRLIAKMGHQAASAASGVEAIRVFQAESPDLIFMDVEMPAMGGYEATAHIKALNPEKWVPIVFLTATQGNDGIARGLDVGGDDYLVKPVSYVVLQAKIRAIQRTLRLQREIEQRKIELENYYRKAEEEVGVASQLMQRMVNNDWSCFPMLQHWLAPAGHFSGDIIAAAGAPGGALHVMLADGTGHGLAAALNVLPIMQPFYKMTQKGYSIGAIAEELNRKVRQWLSVERFVATTLASIDFCNQAITMWNGGNPAQLVLDDKGNALHVFQSQHVPLGVLDPDKFSARVDRYRYHDRCQLVMYSDGVIESEDQARRQLGHQRLVETLRAAAPEQRLAQLRVAVERHFAGHAQHDDISVAMIDCVERAGPEIRLPERNGEPGAAKPDEWEIGLTLGAAELRYIDTVPLLLSLTNQIAATKAHGARIFLILSELFNNALDHGVLQLDSAIKLQSNGMDRYLELRIEQLARLSYARIDIKLKLVAREGKPMLRITVRDSGDGFDYASFLKGAPVVGVSPCGHGIVLVRSICAALEYRGNGSEVAALYHLQQPASDEFAPTRAAAV